MKNLEQYIGRKVKGVSFVSEQYKGITFNSRMNEHIGCEGVIKDYCKGDNSFRVEFESPVKGYWFYPAEVILPQLEGELVGYLINTDDEKYVKIIAGLVVYSVKDLLEVVEGGVHFTPNSHVGEIIAKYDLLDKCTPVYKSNTVELPKINGYEGEDMGDYLQYGCAKISKKWFEETENRYITSLVLNSHVRISSKQMEEIREYLKFTK